MAIIPFPRKHQNSESLRDAVLDLMVQMGEDALHTLQNDVMARDPSARTLPTILEEEFQEWLNEYGGIDREDMMAPERQGETWAQFAEEFIDTHESEPEFENQVALAKHFLAGGKLKSVHPGEIESGPAPETTSDLPKG